MAQEYNELIGLLKELLTNRFSPKPNYIRGLLGDGQGNVQVPDKPDKSYVRFNRGTTEFFEVFNRNVNPVHDWPVLIGQLPWQPGLTQVVDTDWAAFEQSGWGDSIGSTSPHAPTHQWPDGLPGSDPIDVYLRSIVPLRAYTLGTGSTSIYVNAYEYDNTNCSGTVWGGLPGVDLSPVMNVSVTPTGSARYMGIYLNPTTNTLGVVTGTTDIFTDAVSPPLVQFPAGTIPSARVRVYGGQVQVGEIDIRDARRPFGYCVTGSAAGGAPSGFAGGDLTGSYPNPQVAGLFGYSLVDTAPAEGNVLMFSGSAWRPTTLPDTAGGGGVEGRLSLTTGVPVTTSGVTGATTIYFTPFGGNRVELYDGAEWTTVEFTEKSVAVPATIYQLFDIFGYIDGGDLALEVASWNIAWEDISSSTNATPIVITSNGHGLSNGDIVIVYNHTVNTAANGAWVVANVATDTFELANSIGNGTGGTTGSWRKMNTTRATALTVQDGRYVKSGDATRLYLGTAMTGATSGQVDDTFAFRGLWNYYNRRPRPIVVKETADSWTYDSTVWRNANNSGANHIKFVVGLVEDVLRADIGGSMNGSATNAYVGIGLNKNNNSADFVSGGLAPSGIIPLSAGITAYPREGFNYLHMLEICQAASSITFYGDAGLTNILQSGLIGVIWA